MPRVLGMPSKEQLPDGPQRRFVEELFVHYREAGRPALREIAAWITENAESRDLRGTASTETIRRVLSGTVIPRRWATVETILEALCGIARRSTDEQRHESYDRWETPVTFKEELKKRWNAVLDQADENLPELPPRPAPPPEPPSRILADPWASVPLGTSPEEPPF